MKAFKIILAFTFILNISCEYKVKKTNITNSQVLNSSNIKSLAEFLTEISYSDSIKTNYIKAFPSCGEIMNERECQFKNDSINILYLEKFIGRQNESTYEMDSSATLMYFNGKIIKRYSSEEGILSLLDFENYNEKGVKHYSINKETSLYLLKAKSFTSYGNFSKICYGYLIIKQKNNISCFNLQSYNVPGDFYIGKKNGNIIYLDISSDLGIDKNNEYVYEISPKILNLEKLRFEDINDTNNRPIKYVVAIPNGEEFSKFRLVR